MIWNTYVLGSVPKVGKRSQSFDICIAAQEARILAETQPLPSKMHRDGKEAPDSPFPVN